MKRPAFDFPTAFTTAAVRSSGIADRDLRALVTDGTLVQLSRGVYRRANAPLGDEDLVEIALRAPEATLCLVTALSRHELTDQIPDSIDVALPRGQRPPRVAAPTHWHRFDEATFTLGRDRVELDPGVWIGLYSAERCILDAFRLRHLESEELAVEALRRWLRRPGSVPSALLNLARAFPKSGPALLAALRILL